MERDVDRIIIAVKARLPDAEVLQLHVKHPGDDDGVWTFYIPGIDGDVQIDSSYGQCPFLVDNTDNMEPLKAPWVDSVEGVTDLIVNFLSAKRIALPNS